MVPKLPRHMTEEADGAAFDRSKISAKFLDNQKQRRIY